MDDHDFSIPFETLFACVYYDYHSFHVCYRCITASCPPCGIPSSSLSCSQLKPKQLQRNHSTPRSSISIADVTPQVVIVSTSLRTASQVRQSRLLDIRHEFSAQVAILLPVGNLSQHDNLDPGSSYRVSLREWRTPIRAGMRRNSLVKHTSADLRVWPKATDVRREWLLEVY